MNEIGVGTSSTMSLDIKCEKDKTTILYCKLVVNISDSPACVPGQQLVYEVAKLSSVSLSCTMDANPRSGIQFSWQFNTTGHTVNIPVCYYHMVYILLSILYLPSIQTLHSKVLQVLHNTHQEQS